MRWVLPFAGALSRWALSEPLAPFAASAFFGFVAARTENPNRRAMPRSTFVVLAQRKPKKCEPPLRAPSSILLPDLSLPVCRSACARSAFSKSFLCSFFLLAADAADS